MCPSQAALNMMPFSMAFSFTELVLFMCNVVLKYYRNPKGLLLRNFSNAHANNPHHSKLQRHTSLAQRSDLSDHTLIFNMEGSLLKSSSSLFPYFMLVAFEAGSPVRAFLLLFLYPFLCLVSQGVSLKIMVMVCFFGIKKERFSVIGSGVLPKFMMEDVGEEGYEVLRRGGKRVAVSDLPQVMVETFLKDYLEIEFVVGRDLRVFCGYFVGVMEQRKNIHDHYFEEIIVDEDDDKCCSSFIGITNSNKSTWFSHCKVSNIQLAQPFLVSYLMLLYRRHSLSIIGTTYFFSLYFTNNTKR